MDIIIIGAGAVGIALGTSLQNTGHTVTYLARGGTAQAIREGGTARTGLFGEMRAPQATVCERYEELPAADIVLVSAKTLANDAISSSLNEHRQWQKPGAKIVLMQNGWGNDIPYLRYFDKSELFHARIITGFQRSAPNVSNITVHTAPILFGSLYGYDNSGLAPVAQSLSDSGIPSELSDQIGEALWAKLLYNTTLNPLGAILRVPYGVLAACPSSHAIMDGLIEESFAVMHAAGYRTFWETPEQYREAFYGKLVPDTKDHRASTLQDIEKGCPTEIRTLNGCIVDMADKLGIDVPQHRMIVRLIGAVEENMDKPR